MKAVRKVLVTGASGFVGGHVVAGLQGVAVTAVTRSPGTLPPGVANAVVPSIDGITEWGRLLDGVDAVVHLAGLAHRTGSFASAHQSLYEDVNTKGTIRLAEAAARAGVRDFLFASSIHVNGTTTDGRAPFRESDVPAPHGPYGTSKAKAEAGLAEVAARTGLAVTVIRPPVLHGAGAKGNVGRLASALSRGMPLPLASIQNRRAFLGIDNFLGFVEWRLSTPNAWCETFIVADDEQPSTPGFVALLGTAVGRRARLVPFPPSLLRKALSATGREAMAEGLLSSLAVDTSKAKAAGWRPRFTLAEGLRRAFATGVRGDQATES